MKLTDIGDRLNALREQWVNNRILSDIEYYEYDIGVKMIIAAALVEMVKIKRDEQDET